MPNTAIFNGKEFWIGSVNNKDGTIEEVHTYEEAESCDWHHSFYFSEPQLEKISNDICSVFWIDDGEVMGEFWRNEGREPWIIGRIKEQVEMIGEPKQPERSDFKPPMKTKKWKEYQKPFESKTYSEKFELFEKKKRKKPKPKKEQVEDKYKKEKERIKKKREELTEINQSDDTQPIKSARSKVKKIEIEMVEKELDIAKLRDKKLQADKDLKDAKKKEKDKK